MDVIIVLGNSDPEILKKRMDRAIKEFTSSPYEYIRDGNVIANKFILISGGPSATKMKEYALSKHVGEKFLVLEDKSKNTIENIMFSNKLLDNAFQHGMSFLRPSVIICTSSFHIKRSMVIAKMLMCNYNTSFIDTCEDVTYEEYQRENDYIIRAIEFIFPGMKKN